MPQRRFRLIFLSHDLTKKVEVTLFCPRRETLGALQETQAYVVNLARVEKITFQSEGDKPKGSATSVVGEVEVFLPLKGLISLDEEEKRLQKEISKI